MIASPGRAALDLRAALRTALAAVIAVRIAVIVPMLLTLFDASGTHSAPTWAGLRDSLSRWDGQAYLAVADHGYPSGPLDIIPGRPGHLWGFFPGYPLLMHLVSPLTLGDVVLAGVLVSALGEFAALAGLHLLLQELRADPRVATVGTWLLALHPYSPFLVIVYADAAFLGFAIPALLLARRGHEGAAATLAAGALALRITGLAVVAALAVEHLRRRRLRPGWGLLYLIPALLPFVVFLLWARHETGDTLAYFHIQQSASQGTRSLVLPVDGLRATWSAAHADGSALNARVFLLECVFGVLGFLVLLAAAVGWAVRVLARRGRWHWWTPRHAVPLSVIVVGIGIWALPASLSFWLGMPRYMVQLLPAYILGADVLAHRPRARGVVLTTGAAMTAWGATVLASGHFLA